MTAPMFGLIYFVTAFAVPKLSELGAGMAGFWPANAMLLFALLVTRPRIHWQLLLAAFCGSEMGNIVSGNQIWQSCLLSSANILEAWLSIQFLRLFRVRPSQMLEPRGLLMLAVAALLASAAAATLSEFAGERSLGLQWISWFRWDFLGVLLVVPALLVLNRKPLEAARGGQLALVLAAVALMSGVIFFQNRVPFAFLAILPVQYTVFRFGARGAVYATLVVALIAVVATLADHGPFAAWNVEDALQVHLLQAFLAALLLAGLPTAALFEKELRMNRRMVEMERAMRLSSEAARRSLEVAGREAAITHSRDALTGLVTRTRILRKLEAKLAFARKADLPVIVAIIDVDRFKLVNDCFGHNVGDLVLQAIGGLARSWFEPPHAIGRLGGEEFLLVLVGLDSKSALAKIDSFRAQLSELGRVLPPKELSVSVGVSLDEPGASVGSLLKRADEALYTAKDAGRNRVSLAA